MSSTISYHIIESLTQQGITEFVLCPGKRCAPLAEALAENKKARVHIHYDERGGAFFALGLSKASKKPACLITTSGTAVGNLLPAVMEAFHDRVPLILLTADRPLSLYKTGANQTTDHLKIFGDFVRGFFPSIGAVETIPGHCAQAVLEAREGPVHINCPFDEPFFLEKDVFEMPAVKLSPQTLPTPPVDYPIGPSGVIIAAKMDADAPLKQLSEHLKFPLFADITSSCRTNAESTPFLPPDSVDTILYFGGPIVSKKMLQWIGAHKGTLIHVHTREDRFDPYHRVTHRYLGDPSYFCREIIRQHPVRNGLIETPAFSLKEGTSEVHIALNVASYHTEKTALFVGNSMPIRYLNDFYFPEQPVGPIFTNRGLSGIDGNIATIAGIAHYYPTLAIIGDQTFLHDVNSLPLIKKARHPVYLAVINNKGGGIFHFVIDKKELVDPYFSAPHDMTFEEITRGFGLNYSNDIETALQGKSAVIELFSNREENHAFYQNLWTSTTSTVS